MGGARRARFDESDRWAGARPSSTLADRRRRPASLEDSDDGRPQEEDLEGEEPQPPGLGLEARRARPQHSARAAARAKLPHVVCGNCGWYGGRQAIDVD